MVYASAGVAETRLEAGNAGHNTTERAADPALIRLLWDRVDYVLARRSDWVSCARAIADLNRQNGSAREALSGLCGETNKGRDAPAPQQFPAARASPGKTSAGVR